MPCESGDIHDDLRDAYDRADAATRAACEMARILRAYHKFDQLSQETRRWVKRHGRIDRERERDEKREREHSESKERALAKLSRKEREVLGL